MDDKLKAALDSVRSKRGMNAVRLPDKEAGSTYATRGEQPRARYRPSKNRKRNQKDIDARKRWIEKKKLEALDFHPSDLQVLQEAISAISSPPRPKVPPAGSFKSSWIGLPSPTMPSQPVASERTLTHAEAIAAGYVIQKTWGVYQYRAVVGGNWITCRIDDPTVEAPKVGIAIRRPVISELYARTPVSGFDRRCEHAKRGLPPDGSCTGNCDGRFTPNE